MQSKEQRLCSLINHIRFDCIDNHTINDQSWTQEQIDIYDPLFEGICHCLINAYVFDEVHFQELLDEMELLVDRYINEISEELNDPYYMAEQMDKEINKSVYLVKN